jgi:hypothetical protein
MHIYIDFLDIRIYIYIYTHSHIHTCTLRSPRCFTHTIIESAHWLLITLERSSVTSTSLFATVFSIGCPTFCTMKSTSWSATVLKHAKRNRTYALGDVYFLACDRIFALYSDEPTSWSATVLKHTKSNYRYSLVDVYFLVCDRILD